MSFDICSSINKRSFDQAFTMNSSSAKSNEIDLRKQFLNSLNQPDLCEQFYLFMKSEQLGYVLEFYLACDGLRNLLDDTSKQGAIIHLIYKHYLSHGKNLAETNSAKIKFALTEDLLVSIRQRIQQREYQLKFYDQAQEYVLKYMLQMCYPKFLIEQEQREDRNPKRSALSTPTFSPMHRRLMSNKKKDPIDSLKQKSVNRSLNISAPIKVDSHVRPGIQQSNSLEASNLIADHDAGLQFSKQPRTAKLTKQQRDQYSLAQRDPAAFFEELRKRLLAYQTENSTAAKIRSLSQLFNVHNRNFSSLNNDHRTIDDDSTAVLDSQIAKMIDDSDNSLYETPTKSNHRFRSNAFLKPLSFSGQSFTRSDSGVGTDTSERNFETFPRWKNSSTIEVIWYPSLDSHTALLSQIPKVHECLTFKLFRQLFKKQHFYRYFFKTVCTADINKEQYVFRELTMDDEIVPLYDGKIFVQLDRIS